MDPSSATISPVHLTSDYVPADLPTPTESTSASSPTPTSSDRPRRKRKSWGQPIPEYDPILPPGKRAKTNEEKEQRRCERIVRNRKAAATSRDRKKHEFERLEQENQVLREELERQSALIKALQAGQDPSSLQSMVQATSELLPLPSNVLQSPQSIAKDSPVVRPRRRSSSPAMSVASLSNRKHHSPTLAPSLFTKNETPEFESALEPHNTAQSPDESLPTLDNLDTLPGGSELDALINDTINNPQPMLQHFTNLEGSGMTRYPAAVLCDDLQCLPEPTKLASRLNSNRWVNSILVIQLMVLNAMSNISSKTMLSAMSQILTSLEQVLPRLQSCPKTMDMIFPLIHSLITLPSMENTSRRAFRMAFLRRLLSSSPASARLLDDATARALQRLSSAEAIKESPRDGLSWASLLTVRWAIRCVEWEKECYQKRFTGATSMSANEHHSDPERSSGGFTLYEGASIGDLKEACTPAPNVH